MMIRAWLLVPIVATLLAAPPVSTGQVRIPRFSSTTDLVVLHVRVQDRHGAYVDGLGREAFSVSDDDRPQRIRIFMTEDAPVTVGLIIDSSVSMWQLRDELIAGAVDFARASNAEDQLFALAFNGRVRSVLPSSAPFTGSEAVLRQALAGAILPRGRTALFDAIADGLDYAARGSHLRQALVVISDGGDNASRTSFDEVLQRVLASNAVLYTVALIDPLDHDANPGTLQRLAEASGGEAFVPKYADTIGTVLGRIAADVRRTYTIGYMPSSLAGGFHRVHVTAASPDFPALVVRTRRGYVTGSSRPEGR